MFKPFLAFSIALLILQCATFAQRNTILIIADDLGTDYFGFYEGHGDTVDVPHIRSLVSKGVRFKHFYSNPVCSSTRATMLTGRYSFRTGVGYIVGSTAGSGQIDTAELSIPKLLEQYNSQIAKANIGKWHLKNPNPPINLMSPLALGYDWYEGPFIGAINDYFNWNKHTNGVASTITNYATTENVDNAVSWIKTVNPSNPFFLWLAFNAPHDPLHLPPANLHSYNTLSGTAADINAQPKAYFKATIQAMDSEIGRLFDSLQAVNRLDSTDVIFIGDNGNTMRTAQIANLNRAKGTIYDYGIHVPLIIAGPSVTNPGRASNALVNSVDLFATIQDLFGNMTWPVQIPANKPVDSKSLMPILTQSSDSVRPWVFNEIFRTTADSADGKCIRNREYKLLRFDNGKNEFYNLNIDPDESTNLLNGNLSTTDLSNYNYLCNELTQLLNAGSMCLSGVGINPIELSRIMVYPNPFSSKIEIEGLPEGSIVCLQDCTGRILFKGSDIGHKEFSALAEGVYFLRHDNIVIKLIKN
jgi:arylsulfatase B